MMVGSVLVALCFLILGWASDIVGVVVTDEARVSLEALHGLTMPNSPICRPQQLLKLWQSFASMPWISLSMQVFLRRSR